MGDSKFKKKKKIKIRNKKNALIIWIIQITILFKLIFSMKKINICFQIKEFIIKIIIKMINILIIKIRIIIFKIIKKDKEKLLKEFLKKNLLNLMVIIAQLI